MVRVTLFPLPFALRYTVAVTMYCGHCSTIKFKMQMRNEKILFHLYFDEANFLIIQCFSFFAQKKMAENRHLFYSHQIRICRTTVLW